MYSWDVSRETRFGGVRTEFGRLKYTSVYKIRFSPHQISFHVKHNLNTFILVACGPDKGKVRLYPGAWILDLEQKGLKLEPLREGLEACSLELERL